MLLAQGNKYMIRRGPQTFVVNLIYSSGKRPGELTKMKTSLTMNPAEVEVYISLRTIQQNPRRFVCTSELTSLILYRVAE